MSNSVPTNRSRTWQIPPEPDGQHTAAASTMGAGSLCFAIVLIGVLLGISRWNYLFFHALAELGSIAVAWGLFILVWSAHRFLGSNALVFLGCAYFFIGTIDLVHTLAYKGMGIFPDSMEANLATQLWISARYMESISLLAFSLLAGKNFRLKAGWVVGGFSAVMFLVFVTIFVWPVFPDCYIDGVGLTPFKKVSEYLISMILLVALVALRSRRHLFAPAVYTLMTAAIALTIVGELAFTFYINVYGTSNLIGHMAKLLSFFLIYLALIRSGLTEPYTTIFQKWRRSDEQFKRLVETAPFSVMTFDAEGNITYLNPFHLRSLSPGTYDTEHFIGRAIFDLPGLSTARVKDQLTRVLHGEEISMDDVFVPESESEPASYQNIRAVPLGEDEGSAGGGLLIREDVTEKRQQQRRLRLRLELSEYADHHSFEELMQRTLDGAEELTGSSIGFFHLVNADAESLDLVMWSTKTQETYCRVEDFNQHYRISDAGVWCDCLRTGKPVIHNNYEQLPHRRGLPAGHAPLVRELTVPVMRDGRPVAILGVGNKASDYGEEDVRIISELVDLAWDIVSRSKAEKALAQSRNSMETLLGNLPGMAFRCRNDDEWSMVDISEGCRSLTGYSASELIDSRVLSYNDLIHPEDRQRVKTDVEAAVSAGKHYEIEYRILDKSGKERWLWEHGHQVVSDDDTPSMLTGFITEVTDRRRQEAELQRLASAIEQVAEAIIITDPAGKIVFVNAAFENVTGYSRRQAIGSNPRLLNSGQQDAEFYRRMWATIKAGRVWSDTLVNRKKNGSIYTEKTTISPVINESGEIVNFVAVKQDITDDLRLEEKLSQAQKMEAIGTLAGGIAHDFNNILSPMMGFTEMLRDDLPVDSPLQEYVSDVLSATFRARELVKQILTFSRQSDRESSAIRVQQILQEALKLIRASLPSNITINQQIDMNCAPILADPTQIHQIIMNLSTNAYHAMEAQGGVLTLELDTVTIGMKDADIGTLQPGSYICLKVSDTGHGLDPVIQERIFEPYFTTKGEGKGTGLGLSVIHGIVSEYRGDIQVQSTPGKGTTFSVYLPSIKENRPAAPETNESPLQGGHERILLVDDEATITAMISRMLTRLGYSVTARTGSIEALELFKMDPNRFDLVITDMTMPNLTGDRLTLELKKIRPDIPVIICTGFSNRIDAEGARAIGAQGFVHKPILKNDLARTIREALEGEDREPV